MALEPNALRQLRARFAVAEGELADAVALSLKQLPLPTGEPDLERALRDVAGSVEVLSTRLDALEAQLVLKGLVDEGELLAWETAALEAEIEKREQAFLAAEGEKR